MVTLTHLPADGHFESQGAKAGLPAEAPSREQGGEGVVPEVGLEPTRDVIPRDFESRASANFTTPARVEVYQVRLGTGASMALGCPSALLGTMKPARCDRVRSVVVP